LATEASVCLYGVIKEVPEGKTVRIFLFISCRICFRVNEHLILTTLFFIQAPGGHEMAVDYWELVGESPSGGVDNLVNEVS